MDIKNQLLTLAIKPGAKSNSNLIAKAVDDAGYLAIEWYSLEAGKIKAHPYPKFKK